MSLFKTRSHLQQNFAALLFVIPVMANAGADTALTVGSGPDSYRSYTFKANADVFDLPLQINLDHFLAKSTGMDDMRQSGVGFTWDATKLVSANYRYSTTGDGIFDVTGNEGGLSFGLDTLWDGELQTSVDLGYGEFGYKPSTQRVILANRTLTQSRNSFGLSQDISSTINLYASHDQYKYDHNPKALAFIVIRRTRNTSKAAFTLLGFPDKTNTLGMNWNATEALAIDLSSGKTTTILDQQQKNTRLGVDYQFNANLSLAAAVTRVTSTAVINSATGLTVLPASGDTYTELTLGWDF